MTEKEQFKLMHVKIDLRRIMVLSWYMTKFRLANPCQNKKSKQKKHDKRDKINANENKWMSFQHILLFWNVADPVKPLTSYSAQINFDITIWNGSCSAMRGQYILYLVSKERG